MRPRRRSFADRDQEASAFSAILMRLCEGAGALSAALVDSEGETVDYSGTLDPFDTRVMAAEWQLVVRALARSKVPSWPQTRELLVRAKKKSWAVVPLPDGYALVVQLLPHAFSISPRALSEAVRAIVAEAGIDTLLGRAFAVERWARVQVRTCPGDPWRPEAVLAHDVWHPLQVLGVYATGEIDRREIGYRARLDSGAEISLVREPMGNWYSDDLPGG
jgi:hypothetical protein